ncbi:MULTISPECIES: cytochrome P450 [unclassified Bradyrhizobium]|uniref:cytochrome P450 n=1 Tax=unclassified Bradyrhizobium TaxID=2631580 RepID=UPI0015CA5E0F|nr:MULTISPECIES: cytochrome P450 [unclassified Bradyrhizobium]MBB4260534.1 cytochrome P450 [Bradyrhizobium sp. CIR3A]NYG46804.1 cytochrome P450 [Bradyrhizobium sp. IAR9]
MSIALDTNLADIDLIPGRRGPPYDLFTAWRRADPVHWNPAPDRTAYRVVLPGADLHEGFWVLTRYQDVFEVSRDQSLFSSHTGGPIIWDFVDPVRLSQQQAGLMGMPPELHAKVKRLVLPPFANQALAEFEPDVARAAREIVDAVASRGTCEFVFDVASRLPVYTFCTLMGIPEEDREQIFRLGNAAADVEAEKPVGEDPVPQLFAFSAKLAEEKRRNPDRSMMSAYVNGEVDGEKLTDEQIAMFFVTMSIAGHETTRGTAAHFVRLMNEHPEQYALLRSDPDQYLPNAIEEVLRFAPPVIQFRRTATADAAVGGQPIAAGQKLYLSYPAANRDPEVFVDPDRFDITRKNAAKHLSFGTGPHVCIGARLARTQLKLLLKEVVARIPDIRPMGEPRFLRSIWFNAIVNMPVAFTPEGRA